MKLLVDMGVGKAVEGWLADRGHDVKAVRDLNPRMTDDDILALAVREQRLVITMDKDFGYLIFHSGQAHAGVLLLRMEDARSEEKVQAIQRLFSAHADSLSGNFCVYQNNRLRVRPAVTR